MVSLAPKTIRKILYLLIFSLPFLLNIPSFCLAADQKRTKIQFLITSDLHGWLSSSLIYPDKRRTGLLHIADFIQNQRQRNPEAILIDCGDLLQGSPLVHYYNRIAKKPVDNNPFFQAFLSLGYDAVVVGNHDLAVNPLFESAFLKKSNFTWLGANLLRNSVHLVPPYIILNRGGLKIAVIGITTPGASMWLPSDQLAGIKIEPIKDSLKKWLKHIAISESPDLVVGVFHAGLNPFRDDINSKLIRISPANGVKAAIKAVKGLDIAFLGHDHVLNPKNTAQRLIYIQNTAVICGGRWGEAVISVELAFEKSGESWRRVKIEKTVFHASQDDTIAQIYLKKLPSEYKSFLDTKLQYVFGRTLREDAENCINQLVALANDDVTVDGSMLPAVKIFKPSRYFGKKISRSDIYRWLPYDNRSVVVPMNAREIGLILARWAPQGNRKKRPQKSIYLRMKQNKVFREEKKWWLDAKDFRTKYQILVGDYHYQGGGGVLSQFFINFRESRRSSSDFLREKLYSYLSKVNQPLPDSCKFLKASKSED